MQLPAEVREVFSVLAKSGHVGASLCDALANELFSEPTDLSNICLRLGISQSSSHEIEKILRSFESVGLCIRVSPLKWRSALSPLARPLAPLLLGAALFSDAAGKEEENASVVLTMPPRPSKMANALDATLSGAWGIRDTREVFPSIAEAARAAFTVATPYIDSEGAEIVLNLFKITPAIRRHLIIRFDAQGKLPPSLTAALPRLRSLGVQIFNFRLERPDLSGNETFHAKVVLADDISAYVGSFNMHKWSLAYSLELGIYVRGKAAKHVTAIMHAMKEASGIPLI